ncbi:hypothetical protein QD460_06680 [Rhizobium jaguaris]|uniref:hypothetical protein n=1 Tax=Rhizobium jaguaris TaxID=1312183 RepID=UPI0039BFB328
MSSRAVEILVEECTFNPRTLEIKFPEQALAACELPARYFFEVLEDAPRLSSLSFLDERWYDDPTSRHAYELAGPHGRAEINAIICGVLHEVSHRVDLLITPFGVQYLIGAVEEYLLLQEFVPLALDREQTLGALTLLKNVTDGLPSDAAKEPRLAGLWPRLHEVVRRTLAWGDLGNRRPPESEITRGWFEESEHLERLKLSQQDPIELITVCGSVCTFRPKGTKGWYVRPMTIFEAKALANTLLHVLKLSGGQVDEVRLFFNACYGDRLEELEPDYLYIFDVVARILGPLSFQHALATAKSDQIATLLRIVSGVCWFALHAPPVLGDSKLSSAAASVTIRLFVALQELASQLRQQPQLGAVSALCSQFELTKLFRGAQQATIGDALTESIRALDVLGPKVKEIWNPDVRSWFQHLIGVMRPYFDQRDPRYDSLLGMPDDGNIVPGVRRQHEWEALYDDHVPQGGAAEWLALRPTLLFSYEVPTLGNEFVKRLDNHFGARFVMWHCDACSSLLHGQWVSRFSERARLVCPGTGQSIEVPFEDMKSIDIDP